MSERDDRPGPVPLDIPPGVLADLALDAADAAPLDGFVPYFYLDGHRSGGLPGENPYDEGVAFAARALGVAFASGVRDVVFMVHTERNTVDRDRMGALRATLQRSGRMSVLTDGVRVSRYGRDPIALHAPDDRCDDDAPSRHVHLLIGYSEEWASEHPDRVAEIPPVSAVVRFTKAHLGGGWIPARMNHAAFVYCQTPSISRHWSSAGISILLALMRLSQRETAPLVGSRRYAEGEREVVRLRRDDALTLDRYRSEVNPRPTRVIISRPTGPAIYEF